MPVHFRINVDVDDYEVGSGVLPKSPLMRYSWVTLIVTRANLIRTGEELEMPKENIKKMNGVLASVFAHTGHISKEEAKELSGLDDHHFEQAYDKASRIADKVMAHEGGKMEKLLEHFAKEIEEYSEFFLIS